MTVMRRFLCILFFLISGFSFIEAQDVKVTSAFDSARIFIGDQTFFTVTVDKPASYLLDVKQYKDSLYKNIEILKGPVSDSSVKDGRVRITQKYLVTSFDSGFYQIPPVYAELRSKDGIKRFYSDYANLQVMRVRITPSDTTARIFDIVKPYKAPLTAGEVLPWALLIMVAAVAVWFAIKYFKKMQLKKTGKVYIPDPDPAHVIAFRQLEQLKQEKLWENGEIKNYYSRLSEIARLYLENRYGIYSMELTTVETLAELKKSGIKDNESTKKLRTVLTGADLVKFAKFNPEPAENELHYNYIWEYVNETKLIPEPVEKDSEKINGADQKKI